MRKLLLISWVFMIIGCNAPREEFVDGFTISIVDSCEYVSSITGLTHKGNCKYCQEHRKQEMRELIKELRKEE